VFLMTSIVCTLYEGRYDYGVGALVNSLVAAGYAGTLVIGYRGNPPFWLNQCRALGPDRYQAMSVTLLLEKLETTTHFTNYKPTFMLDLFARKGENGEQVEKVFYFDPDIVLKCPWPYIEDWAGAHIALCADVNADCSPLHPLRLAWRRFYEPHGMRFKGLLGTYANAGFVGIPRACLAFLREWHRSLELMGSGVAGGLRTFTSKDRTFAFHMSDQDAMNATMDCTDCPLSIVGQDGMDFVPAGYIMSHAQGRPKPWDKGFIGHSLTGRPPSLPDKSYWKHVSAPIRLYSGAYIRWTRLRLFLASGIGRFYRRS
jgi:hypothetical protein